MPERRCTMEGCEKPAVARGLCWKHYKRLMRHGDARVTLRRYNLPCECRQCGASDPEMFYPTYRGICRACLKRAAVRRWTLLRLVKTDPAG